MKFHFLKKKQAETETKEEERKHPQSGDELLGEKSEGAEKSSPPEKMRGRHSTASFRVLQNPHVTEKANRLAEHHQYVFKVFPHAKKRKIREEVERLFGVDVCKVAVVRIPPKKMRLGKTQGIKQGYKKAIVTLQKGQKIEMFSR